MFSFFKKQKEGDLSLIIDIQSGVVRGALVFNKKEEISHVIYVATEKINKKPHTNSSYLTKAMLNALSDIMEGIMSAGLDKIKELGYSLHSIKNVQYVLSSPWVLSQSKTLKLEFEKETTITDKFVEKIIEKERVKIENDYKSINKDVTDLEFIEHKIFEIKLNGYKVNSFENKKINNLEVSFAATLSSSRILNSIDKIVKRRLHHIKKINYHSALLLNFIAMRLLVPEKDNFIAVHIHSELTDMVVVKNGLSSHLASFPYGTNTLLRKVSSVLKEDIPTTESTLTLFLGDKLQMSETSRLNTLIKPLLQTWYTEYEKSVNNDPTNNFIPKTIYISAHSHTDAFKKIISENNDQANLINFDLSSTDMHVVFEKSAEYNQLIGMYAIALRNML